MNALIACGVSGVGKSSLLDLIAEQQSPFLRGNTPQGMTTQVQSYEIKDWILVDTPGTSDPDPQKESKNHEELVAAVKAFPVQIWMYVICPSSNGGRVTSADVEAYRRIQTCFGVESKSILGVINRHSFEDKEYTRELHLTLQELNIHAAQWVYVPQLDLTLKVILPVRQSLLEAMTIIKTHECKIIRERETVERLKREGEELKRKEEEEKKIQIQRENERQQVLAEQKAECDRKLQEAERQRQAEEAKKQRQQVLLLEQRKKLEELQRIADAQPRPVKCDEAANNGNPCQRYTDQYTVGYVRQHGVPLWNCKWAGNQHHSPRVDWI